MIHTRKVRGIVVFALLLAVLLSGCSLLGGGRAEEEAPMAAEPAETAAPEPTVTPEPTPAREDSAGEDTGTAEAEQPLLFQDSGVTVRLESLELEPSPALTLLLESVREEAASWTIESITIDGVTLPIGAVCEVPPGGSVLYVFELDNPVARIFLKAGEHSASVRSVLTDEAGNTLAEVVSDTQSIRIA